MKLILPTIIVFNLVPAYTQQQPAKSKHRYIYETDLALVKSQKIINITCEDKGFFPNLQEDTALVEEFYMSRTEVTNLSYHQFLNYLAVVDEDTSAWERNFPDTLVWVDLDYSYNDPSTNYYFWHPAYDNYPVVGVTYKQSMAYCEWLTKVYNEDPGRKFKKVEFSLPTRKQFIAASVCGKGQRFFAFDGNKPFGKKGARLNIDNSKKFEIETDKNMCKVIFKPLKGYGHRSYHPENVISFEPNEYGIYNLCGNVEEFISEYGYVKGGSWMDLLKDASLISEEHYSAKDEKSAQRGFRFVMRIIEK